MPKYIRTVTKVDGINQKVILELDSCTNCPLMKFHIQNCLATCREFSSSQSNVVDDFVINYNVNTGEIYDDIKIPDWCALAEDISQLDFDTNTYTIHNDTVFKSVNAITDNDLPVLNAKDLKDNDLLNVSELLPALVVASVMRDKNESDLAYERAYDEYDNYSINNDVIPKYDICSLCGEEDETVSRNTNHGMCDECWKNSHNDSEKKKQAFINNFRLKRGESFKPEKFNYSVLKTKKLKVLIKV